MFFSLHSLKWRVVLIYHISPRTIINAIKFLNELTFEQIFLNMRKLTCTRQKPKLSVIGISLFFTERVSYGNPPQIIIYLAIWRGKLRYQCDNAMVINTHFTQFSIYVHQRWLLASVRLCPAIKMESTDRGRCRLKKSPNLHQIVSALDILIPVFSPKRQKVNKVLPLYNRDHGRWAVSKCPPWDRYWGEAVLVLRPFTLILYELKSIAHRTH